MHKLETIMKRILLSLTVGCLLLFPATTVHAQYQYHVTHPNEISTSYGVSFLGLTLSTFVNLADKFVEWSDILGIEIDDDLKLNAGGSKGVLGVGYSRQLNKTIGVGAAFSFESLSVKLSDNTGSVKPLVANLYVISNTARFNWFRTKSDVFAMYSKVSLGLGLVHGVLMKDTADEISKTYPFFAPQLSPVCLEVGRGFSGFIETGVGLPDLLYAHFGIRARF